MNSEDSVTSAPGNESQPGPDVLAAKDREAPIRVLLIEDNRGYAYFIRYTLMRKHAGHFDLQHVTRLDQGLAEIESSPPDIVLLDLGLPDSAGLETFSSVQEHAHDLPIIILTVLDDDAITMKAVRQGAQDYLLKDKLDKDLLVRSIRYAIARVRAETAVRTLSGRLLQLQDEERRRIAQALHDTTAQNLAALSMNLSMLNRWAGDLPPRARELLDQSLSFADTCCSELRTTSYLLHPPLLDEVGLAGAVRDYADGFAARSGIRVDLELPHDLARLPKEVETALFRIMQESLTNIHRHSRSRTASIAIETREGVVVLSVKDTGHGMPARSAQPRQAGLERLGVGIAGMRERVRQLGGSLSISSSATGTIVKATLPLHGDPT